MNQAMKANAIGFGGKMFTKPSDEFEQAFRQGYKKGYERACKKAIDNILQQYPGVGRIILKNLTEQKTADDLKRNCESLMNVGVNSPDIEALRYIKLSVFESMLRGEIGVCND